MTRRALRLACALLAAAALAAACGAPRKPAVVMGSLDDARVTANVKTVLLNDPGIGALRIDVTTSGGVVTLSGTVRSREEEAAAIALAKRADGVKDVKSALTIVP